MERHLRDRRDNGAKLLVAYITGGYDGWEAAVESAAAAGADAIEIGIPFSDPVMDGPVIQEASQAALETGATPASVLSSVLHSRLPHGPRGSHMQLAALICTSQLSAAPRGSHLNLAAHK